MILIREMNERTVDHMINGYHNYTSFMYFLYNVFKPILKWNIQFEFEISKGRDFQISAPLL